LLENLRLIEQNKNMLPPPITGIPASKVGQIVQEFIDNDGVKDLTVDQQSEGTYTVTPVG
jgi:hypothetical protein